MSKTWNQTHNWRNKALLKVVLKWKEEYGKYKKLWYLYKWGQEWRLAVYDQLDFTCFDPFEDGECDESTFRKYVLNIHWFRTGDNVSEMCSHWERLSSTRNAREDWHPKFWTIDWQPWTPSEMIELWKAGKFRYYVAGANETGGVACYDMDGSYGFKEVAHYEEKYGWWRRVPTTCLNLVQRVGINGRKRKSLSLQKKLKFIKSEIRKQLRIAFQKNSTSSWCQPEWLEFAGFDEDEIRTRMSLEEMIKAAQERKLRAHHGVQHGEQHLNKWFDTTSQWGYNEKELADADGKLIVPLNRTGPLFESKSKSNESSESNESNEMLVEELSHEEREARKQQQEEYDRQTAERRLAEARRAEEISKNPPKSKWDDGNDSF